ncbi:hypothetical protein SAMD00019534_083270 [Acytostelium subglobosum LB1]|uniref:hypothetical protein n=1 Tax=Acytostelium subglobosum LB1 TaxID=1410327 RepID=UPI000644FC51|nr:hypothetical protein SAMD00019534_083270 [Acytostelium subglobosum LB1]GAM25152.1 hypothetical protein SAMD00019534_083270 [Acytostelium subglobosum LB1]|eukprot:XP_012751672.1 hypothetical protein SAMD00019534_083270 [Acytostelium subglobosum LB1]
MASLTNSKSSPSFYKDDIDSGATAAAGADNIEGFGDLSDLIIPSLNIPELLDELNQHSTEENVAALNALLSFDTSNIDPDFNLLDDGANNNIVDPNNNNSTNNNNGSLNSSGNSITKKCGTGPRLGYQIYRTFPYRGSLPKPLIQMIELGLQGDHQNLSATNDDEGDGSSSAAVGLEQQKKKPFSTNGLRHCKQYRALFQGEIDIKQEADKQTKQQSSDLGESSGVGQPNSNNNNNNNNVNNISSGSFDLIVAQDHPSISDESFFQPPPMISPRSLQLQQQQEEEENAKTLQQQQQSTEDQCDTSMNTSSQYSQLIESLATVGGESDCFNTSIDDLALGLDDLKSFNLDDISLNLSADGKDLLEPPAATEASQQAPGSPIAAVLPPSHHTLSSTSSPPKRAREPTASATVSPIFIDSNAHRIKGNPEQQQSDKKQQLSRTITFADPSSIQSFFGGGANNNSADLSTTTNATATQQAPPLLAHEKTSSTGYRGLSSIFPKLQINNSNPSPSKFCYPLLQPQPTTLIREYAIKADTNTKGLRRAKKSSMDMEDEYVVHYPFGDDPQMALFAVFDGHSGKNVAMTAKEILPNILLKYIQSAKSECGKHIYDMSGVFLATFKETDAQLSRFEYEGATATIVLIWRVGQQRFLQAANVGDSSAFLSYAGETLVLTKDHRVTDPDEQQRIKDEGVQLSENQTRINGLMVSRALGDHFIKHLNCGLSGEPTISPPISLTPFHSHLIVASDGLWDVISGNRAMEMIKTEKEVDKMANLLLQCSLKSIKSKDNISIIVAKL